MNKIVFKGIDEVVYNEKMPNGVDVYLYPTNKTKNFYMTISVKYGGNVKEYISNNEVVNVIPGTAHFLEHKVLNFTNREKLSNRINELGLYSNAYTSYDITNYNMYGSNNSIEAMRLLLDLFYNINVNNKNVEAEKGIISEEFKMYNDDPNFRIYNTIYSNVFKNSYMKDILVGNLDQIKSINTDLLKKVYSDFYKTDNTFIIVTGNFDLDNMIEFLRNYMKNIKPSKLNIKVMKEKEPERIINKEVEIYEDITISKIIYSLKIKKNKIKVKNEVLKRVYLNMFFASLFSNTSSLYERYKSSKLMQGMSYSLMEASGYYLMNLSIKTMNPNEVISKLKKDLKNPIIDEETFNRKKKMYMNDVILGFENIEDVESLIAGHLVKLGRVVNNQAELIKKMNFEELKNEVIKNIDFNNYSILKVNIKK